MTKSRPQTRKEPRPHKASTANKKTAKNSDNPKNANLQQLRSLRQLVTGQFEGYHRSLYAAVQEAVQIAETYTADKKLWREFIKSDIVPRKLAMSDRSKAEKWTLMSVFDCDPKTGSLYIRAVRYLRREGIRTDQISEKLEELGGVRKVASLGSKSKAIDASTTLPSLEEDDTLEENVEIPAILIVEPDAKNLLSMRRYTTLQLMADIQDTGNPMILQVAYAQDIDPPDY